MTDKQPAAAWRKKLDPIKIAERFKTETGGSSKAAPTISVSPMEISVALQKLVEGGMEVEAAAKCFGRLKGWAMMHIRLQELPADVQELFGPSHAPGKRLPLADATDIFRKKDPQDQRILAGEYFSAPQSRSGTRVWKGVDPDSQVSKNPASQGTRLIHRSAPFNPGTSKRQPRPSR